MLAIKELSAWSGAQNAIGISMGWVEILWVFYIKWANCIFIFVPSLSLNTDVAWCCPFSTAKSLPGGILSIPNPNGINPNHARLGIQSKLKCTPFWGLILVCYLATSLDHRPYLHFHEGFKATRRSHSKWPNGLPRAGLLSGIGCPNAHAHRDHILFISSSRAWRINTLMDPLFYFYSSK